ncbi:Mitochondrial carrier domain-containing protein [Cynara cardunculus var. scolymus]|uniref:Mitochondrial carrier domain-containing protein n=1 Tax=Cynara cardunculus var. scolymus TaxID=59895 RepID=A0A118K1H5_CYNCS|nr:Mitochondrial carrier domain-containing protein [Cynara cardunculus var. scolymus]
MAASQAVNWQWENAAAGSVAGLATVTFSHPLDVVRTRFQVNDGRNPHVPSYKNTRQALFTIARSECFGKEECKRSISDEILFFMNYMDNIFSGSQRALCWLLSCCTRLNYLLGVILLLRYLRFHIYHASDFSGVAYMHIRPPDMILSFYYSYSKAKQRYLKNRDKLTPGLHLASAAEAGGLVCVLTNPVWLVKTRLQLQTPQHQTRPYSGFHDALKTVVKDEGWKALYKGLVPGLFLQVSHGAIQFTAYEELRKVLVNFRFERSVLISGSADLLTTIDYATLGASSKLAAILVTYPFQVIRARLQQRPGINGVPRYMDSWQVMKRTARLEGLNGFYKGITANILKNLPSSSLTFVVYENILNMLKLARAKE